jgi:ADP-heptose:LPS heptosyltransferase
MQETGRDIVYILHWGDLTSTVRMLAAARLIRDAHKRDRLVLLTTPEYHAFLKHCPYFNAVETDALAEGRPAMQARDKRFKSARPARVYDLVGDREARRLRKLTRAQAVEAAPDPRTGRHAVEDVAIRLGEAGLGPTDYHLGAAPAPEIAWVDYLARKSRMLDPEYFGLDAPFALLAPAGEEVKASLRWPKERWASLAHDLLQEGVIPAVVGGPDSREIGRYVAHVTPGARDLTGKAKLTQLAGLARRTRFIFGEDTSLLHLLTASGAPALAFYPDVEAPELDAPRGEGSIILMRAPTVAQILPAEAISAMRFAGGFRPQAAPDQDPAEQAAAH